LAPRHRTGDTRARPTICLGPAPVNREGVAVNWHWQGEDGTWLGLGLFLVLMALLAVAELIAPARREATEAPGRLPTNFGFGLINGALATLLPLSGVVAAGWAREQGIGLFNMVSMPAAALVLATLVLRSLLAYWIHRLFHRSPLLWRVHRVHHCDTALDLSTGFRSHPIELALVAGIAAAAAVLIGLSPEALLAYEIAAIAVVLGTHANVKIPERLDRALRSLMVTPAMHHVHHSAHQPQTDSNYGEVLSIWDRLFGTYSAPRTDIRLGLGDFYDGDAASLPRQLLLPFGAPDRAGAAARSR
jgi:sterol desaturase/sphingolipid hydroxylase (fatty acid hydroxylase superfamily)